jgi:RNA polymerase sigma factor (TIGR02999 family)
MPIDSPPLESATQGELVARAGRTMRGIVIEHLRARQADKHGGAAVSAPHEALIDLDSLPDREVLVLNDALAALARAEPPLAELVELKFFAGLNLAEIAALRETSESTVQHDWERARLFLFAAIRE